MGALALILFVVVIIPMLLWGIIDPRGMWEATSSWQFRDPEANEPSDSAFAMQRFSAFVSLLVIVGAFFFVMSASHRNASGRATDDVTPHVYPNIYSSSDGEDSDGYAETTVTPSPVDPFPSSSMTAVGSGDPVVLFKPVLEGAAGEQKSDSSVSIGVDAFYYSWLPGDPSECLRRGKRRRLQGRLGDARSCPSDHGQWWRIGTGRGVCDYCPDDKGGVRRHVGIGRRV